MTQDSTSRTLVVLALLGVLAWCVWLVRDVLPPFLISLGLALLLDPLIDRMQRRGLPRGVAVGIAFTVTLGVLIGVVVSVLPRAIGQVVDLLRNIDVYSAKVQLTVDAWAQRNTGLLARLGLPPTLNEIISAHQADITRFVQVALQSAAASLQGLAGALGWLLVIPIVTLYLMIDLDALKARMRHAIPPQHRAMVGQMSVQVGDVFAAYIRGLTMICLSFGLAIYVVLGLIFGLSYAIILALLAVVLYAIPYLGQLALLIAAAAIAWATGRPPGYIAGVAIGCVLVGQLFDQLVTPRVMGKQVGLHPVLGVFALMVGGQLFGLPGMVIAVPAAASIRVVLIQLFPRLGEPIPGFARDRKPLRRIPAPVVQAPAAETTKAASGVDARLEASLHDAQDGVA